MRLQHLDQPLPGCQARQRNSGRHIERIPGRHLRQGGLLHDDVLGKGTDPLQRQPCIDGVARPELSDLAPDPLDDARALVAQRLRQPVILNQPDASRDEEQLQRIDGRRAHLHQHLVRSRFRNGNLPDNEPAGFRISIQLCSLHAFNRLFSFFDAWARRRSRMTASRFSMAQASSSSRIGRSVPPRAVSAYSTRGGTSA